MNYVKRQIAATPGGEAGEAPDDEAFAKKFPALWEYLSVTSWEPGKPRKPSTLSLSISDGRWTACFVDKDGNRLTFLSGTAFASLLSTLDKKLQDDSVEWRKCKDWKKR